MKLIRFFIIIILLIFISACNNEIIFNGSSKESFEKSLKEAKKNLTGIENDKLGEAIAIIIKYKTKSNNDLDKWQELRQIMDKKYLNEVFDLAEQIAHDNEFIWIRNSAPNKEFSLPKEIDTVIISDPNKPDFDQIKNAYSLAIKVQIYKNDSLNINDLYIYPSLMNKKDKIINFSNLPLKMIVLIKSKNKIIHTFNAEFSNSNMTDHLSKQEIKLALKYINSEKLVNNLIDVECKVNTPNGYFTAYQKNVPIELNP